MLETSYPPASSADLGNEHHRIEALQPVNMEVAVRELTAEQLAALRALCVG